MGKLTGMAGDQLSLCAQRLQGPSLRLCLVLGHVCPRNVSSRANLKRALSRHLWGFQPCPASHGSRIKRVPLKAGPGDGVLPLGHPEKRQLERAAGIWSRAASCPWLSHFYTQHQNILSCWHPALLLRSNMAGCPTFSLKALPSSRALYAAQGTTPSPKPGIPHAYLPHPSGAFSISLPIP